MNLRTARVAAALLAAAFAGALAAFLLATPFVLRGVRLAGPVDGQDFFLALAASLMTVLVVATARVARDPVANAPLLDLVAVAKFASAIAAVGLVAVGGGAGLLVIAAVDAPLGVAAACLRRRIRADSAGDDE